MSADGSESRCNRQCQLRVTGGIRPRGSERPWHRQDHPDASVRSGPYLGKITAAAERNCRKMTNHTGWSAIDAVRLDQVDE